MSLQYGRDFFNYYAQLGVSTILPMNLWAAIKRDCSSKIIQAKELEWGGADAQTGMPYGIP